MWCPSRYICWLLCVGHNWRFICFHHRCTLCIIVIPWIMYTSFGVIGRPLGLYTYGAHNIPGVSILPQRSTTTKNECTDIISRICPNIEPKWILLYNVYGSVTLSRHFLYLSHIQKHSLIFSLPRFGIVACPLNGCCNTKFYDPFPKSSEQLDLDDDKGIVDSLLHVGS